MRTYLVTFAKDQKWTVAKVKHLAKQDLLKHVLRHWGLHNIRDGWNSEAKRRAKLLFGGADVKIGSTKAHLKEEMQKNEKMMEKMYARFRAVDTDGSGFLEYDELRRILKPMGYNAEGIQGLLEQFDLDKDDALSFDEFNELSEFLIVGTEKIEEKARRDAEKNAERERIRADKAQKLSMEEMASAAKEANLCVAMCGRARPAVAAVAPCRPRRTV